ncbi:MAG: glycosyltransferase family 2 protein [Desulfuromonadaceae bacterium]|nr:glycosyltransferase family 2 protein [Desulfuromonadaceae bacterium]MDD5106907.1 glycosyltransferase family 2 protein [Desulfuromonadaceae bacterium]
MIEPEQGEQPFFTIGVPTFKRHELLKETLNSVIAQGFSNFEVIVGNDYTAEIMTGDMIGISDPRIRFVNHSVNLKEVGNMNALLEMATGRYFTWLFDDDLYEPDFLQTARNCLEESRFPPVLFPAFKILKYDEEFRPGKVRHTSTIEFTGREFLCWYSARNPQLVSTAGLFDTTVLRSTVGGFEELSPSTIGLYSEFHFLVKCAMLHRIVYIDSPFYVFRRHEGSWTETNVDMENHLIAAQALVKKSAEILRHPSLVEDFAANLFKICCTHILFFAYKAGRLEYARKEFGIGAVSRALIILWKESLHTRDLYITLCGDKSFCTFLAFLNEIFYCSYLIIRHFAHYFFKSLKE